MLSTLLLRFVLSTLFYGYFKFTVEFLSYASRVSLVILTKLSLFYLESDSL